MLNEGLPVNNLSPQSRAAFLERVACESHDKGLDITSEEQRIVDSLCSEDILKQEGRRVWFTHDVFEEWSIARYFNTNINSLDDLANIFDNFPESSRSRRGFILYSESLIEHSSTFDTWLDYLQCLDKNASSLIWKDFFLEGLLRTKDSITGLQKISPFLFKQGRKFIMDIFRVLSINCVDFISGTQDQVIPVPEIVPWMRTIKYFEEFFNDLDINEKEIYSDRCLSLFQLQLFNGPFGERTFSELLAAWMYFVQINDDLPSILVENVISMVYCTSHFKTIPISDFLESLKGKRERQSRDVLLEKFGWFILCMRNPSLAYDLLKKSLIKDRDRDPRPFFPFSSRIELDSAFQHVSWMAYPSWGSSGGGSFPFEHFLRSHRTEGLMLIKDVVNHAVERWRCQNEPLIIPPLQLVNQTSTPVKTPFSYYNTLVEFWGDERVYYWHLPLGMCPEIVKCALVGLKRWFNVEIDREHDLREMIATILEDSRCIAFASVCIEVLLFRLMNEPDSERLRDAIIPFIQHPIFYILEHVREINNYGVGLKGLRFSEYGAKLVLGPDFEGKGSLIGKMKQFKDNMPLFFEEEEVVEEILSRRRNILENIGLGADIKNWEVRRSKDEIHLLPPANKESRKRAEDAEYMFFLLKKKHNAVAFLKSGEFEDGDSERWFLDFFNKHQENMETIRRRDDSNFVLQEYYDLIVAFLSGMIVHDFETLKRENILEQTKMIMVQALEAEPRLYYSINPTMFDRSAACALPLLYHREGGKNLEKLISKVIYHHIPEVRDAFFNTLQHFWGTNLKFVRKCIRQAIRSACIKGVEDHQHFLIIKKNRDPRIQLTKPKNLKEQITRNAIKFKKRTKRFFLLVKSSIIVSFRDINLEYIDHEVLSSILEAIPLEKRVSAGVLSFIIDWLMEILRYTWRAVQYYESKNQKNESDANRSLHKHFFHALAGRRPFGEKVVYRTIKFIFTNLDHLEDIQAHVLSKEIISVIKPQGPLSECILRSLIECGSSNDRERLFILFWREIQKGFLRDLSSGKRVSPTIQNVLFFHDFNRPLVNNQFTENMQRLFHDLIRDFLPFGFQHGIMTFLLLYPDPRLTCTFLICYHEALQSREEKLVLGSRFTNHLSTIIRTLVSSGDWNGLKKNMVNTVRFFTNYLREQGISETSHIDAFLV